MKTLILLCSIIPIILSRSSSNAMEFRDEDVYRLPPLFHLDDQQRCLSQPDGLYCLGTFSIQPATTPHPLYDFIKTYSELPYKFNRTVIRRGWCVSARCKWGQRNGSLAEGGGDGSVRFARCAAQWGRARALTTSLHTLHYCRSHHHTLAPHTHTPQQRTFLDIVYVILVLNVVGTVYDVMTGDDTKKIKLLTAWSIPANWRRLTAVHDRGDPRLSSLNILQGVKAILMWLMIYGHVTYMVYRFFIGNVEYVENLFNRLDGILLFNGTSTVHVFFTISSFLTTFNLLLDSEKKQLSLRMIPTHILKRIFRLAPVNLLVVGYAATWWPHGRRGPLVASVIGAESRHCHNKFWAQALFINNIIEPDDNCLTPTWFMAVNFHIFLLTCILTLSSGWFRRNALVVYPALVVATSMLNGLLTYLLNYKPAVHIMTPENLSTLFRGEPSFSHFYNSTWGALPASFIGMTMAHLHYDFQKKKINMSDFKGLAYFQYFAIPLTIFWIAVVGMYVRNYESAIISALNICVDRTVIVTILSTAILSIMNCDGGMQRFFAWRGWNVMARVSLPMMLVHWCVNVLIAVRPYVYHASTLDTLVDMVATGVISYAIAVPVSVLVEIPMQKFLSSLVF